MQQRDDMDPELQRKVALQTQLLTAEQQAKQQNEAMALAQKAIMISQRKSQPAAPPTPQTTQSGNVDLMEMVRQQQVMLEMEKHKQQRIEEEQKVSGSLLSSPPNIPFPHTHYSDNAEK